MIKFIVQIIIFSIMTTFVLSTMHCVLRNPVIPTEWISVSNECLNGMRRQIQVEADASFQYLAMGAYFSRDTVNRPGLADIFFLFAKEEREEATKLIQHLSMNGQLTTDITNLIRIPAVHKDEWKDASEALEDALKMETEQTKSLRKVIIECEKKYNHYTVVKNLVNEFLESQVQDQRNLAGKLNTLKKMMVNHGALGEFLFDKDLLNKVYYVTNSY